MKNLNTSNGLRQIPLLLCLTFHSCEVSSLVVYLSKDHWRLVLRANDWFSDHIGHKILDLVLTDRVNFGLNLEPLLFPPFEPHTVRVGWKTGMKSYLEMTKFGFPALIAIVRQRRIHPPCQVLRKLRHPQTSPRSPPPGSCWGCQPTKRMKKFSEPGEGGLLERGSAQIDDSSRVSDRGTWKIRREEQEWARGNAMHWPPLGWGALRIGRFPPQYMDGYYIFSLFVHPIQDNCRLGNQWSWILSIFSLSVGYPTSEEQEGGSSLRPLLSYSA